MKILKPLGLFILSLVWISLVYVESIDDLRYLSMDIQNVKFDSRLLIEIGILPVTYVWIFYIFFKLMFKADKVLK